MHTRHHNNVSITRNLSTTETY